MAALKSLTVLLSEKKPAWEELMRKEIEKRGLAFRFMLKFFLPVKVNFVTQGEQVAVVVDLGGIDITEGGVPDPDVVVYGDRDALVGLLEDPSAIAYQEAVEQGAISLEAKTLKGKQVLSQLEKFFST